VNSEALQAVTSQIASLAQRPTRDLVRQYEEVFGAPPRSRNVRWLRKRIAFRLQEDAEGGLSDRARLRVAELGDELPLGWRERLARLHAAASAASAAAAPPASRSTAQHCAPPKRAPVARRDPRLPAPGTVLKRTHDGVEHQVVVLDIGFEYRAETFTNLSNVARLITGTSWNGYLFFGLQQRTKKEST
jgi:hypothetical protein